LRITRVETIPIQVPIRPQFMIKAARGSHAASPFLLVRIHTSAGISGLGEVSCTPRWSGEDQVTAAHIINRYLAPAIEGEDPTRSDLAQVIDRTVARNSFTKAGVEMALWDIRGKAEGVPVYQLLGGAVRDAVATKWSISGVAPTKAAEIAAWAASEGFKTMKVKVGIDNDEDVARVGAVRAQVGPAVRLGVDANGGWSPETAVQVLDRLRVHNIYFAEQPVAPADLNGMAAVRRSTHIPVVADESVFSMQDAATVIGAGAADVISVYIGKAGGIAAARNIISTAQAAGLDCTVGSNLEMGVGSAAMIHLAIATRGITSDEYPCDIIGPFYYEDDVIAESLAIRGGSARPSDRPGLGVELDETKVRKYEVR
jgi:L-alanine-DL-glutamate epimerase-like enolase superfamily enzyme